MEKDPADLTTKQRILEAAAQVFAESGYNGARVDEIARRAGVNKALIYYYYDNKESLLSILFQETRDAVFALLDSGFVASMDYSSPESTARFLRSILDLLEERQNVIRLVIMESAKRTPINDRIFAMLDEILTRMFKVADEARLPLEKDRTKGMITEFFTGIMPLLNYVAYHEIWMDRFGIEEPELRENFIEAFMGTHFAYTLGTVTLGTVALGQKSD
ncbi:MAG: helix-turn-helix domain-containing protein [Spirochaetota bacterium]